MPTKLLLLENEEELTETRRAQADFVFLQVSHQPEHLSHSINNISSGVALCC